MGCYFSCISFGRVWSFWHSQRWSIGLVIVFQKKKFISKRHPQIYSVPSRLPKTQSTKEQLVSDKFRMSTSKARNCILTIAGCGPSGIHLSVDIFTQLRLCSLLYVCLLGCYSLFLKCFVSSSQEWFIFFCTFRWGEIVVSRGSGDEWRSVRGQDLHRRGGTIRHCPVQALLQWPTTIPLCDIQTFGRAHAQVKRYTVQEWWDSCQNQKYSKGRGREKGLQAPFPHQVKVWWTCLCLA